MDPAAAEQMFHQSSAQAQHRVSHNWEAETIRGNRAMQELDSWLQKLSAEWNKTLLSRTPADVMVYLESHWLAQHAGTTLPDGAVIASPKGVSQCLSSCSTGFKLIGRVCEWHPLANSGNPVESTLINRYRKGYRLEAWRAGYLKVQQCQCKPARCFILWTTWTAYLLGSAPRLFSSPCSETLCSCC